MSGGLSGSNSGAESGGLSGSNTSLEEVLIRVCLWAARVNFRWDDLLDRTPYFDDASTQLDYGRGRSRHTHCN